MKSNEGVFATRSTIRLVARPIDVIEAAYSLEGDDETWLEALARSASASLDRGAGVAAYLVDIATLRTRALAATSLLLRRFMEGLGSAHPPTFTTEFRARSMRFDSVSESFRGIEEPSITGSRPRLRSDSRTRSASRALEPGSLRAAQGAARGRRTSRTRSASVLRTRGCSSLAVSESSV